MTSMMSRIHRHDQKCLLGRTRFSTNSVLGWFFFLSGRFRRKRFEFDSNFHRVGIEILLIPWQRNPQHLVESSAMGRGPSTNWGGSFCGNQMIHSWEQIVERIFFSPLKIFLLRSATKRVSAIWYQMEHFWIVWCQFLWQKKRSFSVRFAVNIQGMA